MTSKAMALAAIPILGHEQAWERELPPVPPSPNCREGTSAFCTRSSPAFLAACGLDDDGRCIVCHRVIQDKDTDYCGAICAIDAEND